MMRPLTSCFALALACAVAVPDLATSGGSSSFLPSYMQVQNPMIASETWDDYLRDETVGSAVVFDGDDLMSLDAPVQAFDSATVPFSLRQRSDTGLRITGLKVVVDENPMPLAAEFKFGEAMGEVQFEGRVRYDVFSNIRAIAQVEDGRLFMVGRFVQAAGGCSAAVSRDMAVAEASMGQMKLRHFDTSGGMQSEASGVQREAQLLIKHPNFTGMQVHAGTLDYIDARFVDTIEVKLDDEVLFTMTGGFSISENPAFRFTYTDTGAANMTVRAVDTNGAVFTQSFPLRSGA
ncbi:MAG: quinoprotein dehydrogenase-associated SoxYZ-like carrier [Sedimentitalea sp.]